jgi:RimJ/RimL family protein N-acetyltransferase
VVRTIPTDRLLLRGWRDADRAPFAALNADPRVMEYFASGALSRRESDALADRIEAHFVARGFGLWAIDVPGVAAFAGFCGLAVPSFTAHFTPCVEIGWRLAPECWGRGYATEAARAVLAHAFGPLGLHQVVSFTTASNLRSQRVMQRIGMTRDPADDFDHPGVAEGHPLRRHVLYRAVSRPT